MPARLTAHPSFRPSRTWLLREERSPYLLGRDDDVDLVVQDDRVSARHARVRYREGWEVEDLDSKNGLFVDGSVADRRPLPETHWLELGGVLARFETVSPEEADRLAEGDRARWRESNALRRRLSPELPLKELLDRFLDSVLRLSELDRAFVLLRSGEGDLQIVAHRGLEIPDLESPRFRGSAGAVERVLVEREPLATTDASLDTWLGARASILTGSIRGLACVPLVGGGGDLLGALYADSKKPGTEVTELDLEILVALAEQTALVLSLLSVQRELELLRERAGPERLSGTIPSGTLEGASWNRVARAAGESE